MQSENLLFWLRVFCEAAMDFSPKPLLYNAIMLENGKAVANDPGCGCCGGPTEVTAQQVDGYIAELEAMLRQAQQVRQAMQLTPAEISDFIADHE